MYWHRNGITLIEMLVAMAITLVMMAALVTVFEQIGRAVNDSRATIEMSGRVRNTRQQMQTDLGSITCTIVPWTRPEAAAGYFEYLEGPFHDLNPTSLPLNATTSLVPPNSQGTYGGEPIGLGDYDDILMFTVRTRGEPFVGRFGMDVIESPVAEVVWYAVENPDVPSMDPRYLGEPGMRTVYRRVLLVAPWADLSNAPIDTTSYYDLYDVSARVENGKWVPNTLADLTKRENRFAHRPDFPHAVDHTTICPVAPDPHSPGVTPLQPFGLPFQTHNDRQGEDVLLTNVLAFDVRAFDPRAPLIRHSLSGQVVVPGDSGWSADDLQVASGAYVDLGYEPSLNPATFFSGLNVPKSLLGSSPLSDRVYDTWSFHYEHDGIDQDGDISIDEGTNGFDDDNNDGVDDMNERETSPPYPVPLRGLDVRFRVYEPDSRQIRQVSLRQSFVSE